MITKYEELVKSIVFFVDFGEKAWVYVYKNQEGFYFPVLMKKELFDILLTMDQVAVSESFWIDDGYTFKITENDFLTL